MTTFQVGGKLKERFPRGKHVAICDVIYTPQNIQRSSITSLWTQYPHACHVAICDVIVISEIKLHHMYPRDQHVTSCDVNYISQNIIWILNLK